VLTLGLNRPVGLLAPESKGRGGRAAPGKPIGNHPEDSQPVTLHDGRYGHYVKWGKVNATIPKDDDVLTIGLNRAVDLLAQESKGRGRGAPAGKPIGNHPGDSQPVTLHDGRYGHYVKWGKVNATIPKEIAPESITLEQAIGLIADRVAKGGGGGRFKKAAKKAPKQELSEAAPKDVKPKAAKKTAKPKAAKKATPKAAKKATKKSSE